MSQISVFFFTASLMATLGIGGYFYNARLEATAQFREPIEVQGSYVRARCGKSGGRGGQAHPTLFIVYRYRPTGSSLLLGYEAQNSQSFNSVDQCSAALQLIEEERPFANFWYESSEPWRYEFYLTKSSPTEILWIFLPIAALMFGAGVLHQKKINQRSAKHKRSAKRD
jgi:hypothetical protein